jgi:hypothetical protein
MLGYDHGDFVFGSPTESTYQKRKSRITESHVQLEAAHKRWRTMAEIINHHRDENTKRVPCPICNTLVKPELQSQHDDMLHLPKMPLFQSMDQARGHRQVSRG